MRASQRIALAGIFTALAFLAMVAALASLVVSPSKVFAIGAGCLALVAVSSSILNNVPRQ